MAEKQVGIRELKAHLSEYLREIKAGHTIIITEHGQPVGRLVPSAQPLTERVEALRQAGLLTWNGKKLPAGRPVMPLAHGQTLTDLISEGRE